MGSEASQAATSSPRRRREPLCPSPHLALEPPRGFFRPSPSPDRLRAPSPSLPVPGIGRPLTGEAPQLQEPPPSPAERARHPRCHLGSGHAAYSDAPYSTESAVWPLPPSPRSGSFVLSREARGAEPADAEKPGARPGRQVSDHQVVREPDLPQRPRSGPPSAPCPLISHPQPRPSAETWLWPPP